MASMLKIALLVSGSAAIGIAGYCVYRKFKKMTVSQQEAGASKCSEVTETPVVNTPAPVAPKAPESEPADILLGETPDPVSAEHHIAEAVEELVESPVTVSDIDPTVGFSPQTPASVDHVEPAVPEEEVTTLSVIVDKNIIIYGVEVTRSKERFVFTNGVRQMVEPGMPEKEAESIDRLQNAIWRRISSITRADRNKTCLMQKSTVGRIQLKTRTLNDVRSKKTDYVLMQITPADKHVLPGMKTMYIMVERNDLIIPSEGCALNSQEWKYQTAAVYSHLLHALDGLNGMTKDEVCGVRKAMRTHFLAIGAAYTPAPALD